MFTFVSSVSLNTYVNLFSLRGRVELAVFPALPTRCIAEATGNNEMNPKNELKKNHRTIRTQSCTKEKSHNQNQSSKVYPKTKISKPYPR